MTKYRGRGLLLLIVVLALVFGFRGVASDPPAPAHSAPATTGNGAGRYVALGDSYTSAGSIGGPARSGPRGCARAENNYPHLVAKELRPVEFVDVSCGGAVTADLTGPQQTPDGVNPPQLEAVTPRTTLVTLGIGGNDVGLISLAKNCVTSAKDSSPCRDRLTAGGQDQLAALTAATGDRIAAALATIRRQAPAARIVLVGYPTILPDDDGACWPTLPVGAPDVGYLRSSIAGLNAELAATARAAGAEFADTATPSRGRDMCAPPELRWVEGPVPVAQGSALHPNAAGERAMADVVLRLAR